MSQDFSAGQRLGDYEILAVLGAGGMGKVYKVRNVISDRVEAMKILLPNLSSQQELADRFLREIKLLASLNHPNIAQLRTALTIDNQLVMIMEFVEGVTIASRITDGPMPPGAAVNCVDQVLAALSYAHKQNIVHRDVKPANMMLTPQGVVKLMDFGIARSASDRGLTMTGTTLGSLNYMPPEQVKGEPADARSDLYSLGVSLYEMVTGRLPFQGDSSYSLMAAHLQEPPKPPIMYQPSLPDALNQIILIALEKDPAKRFQSADAFRGALKSVGVGQQIATQPATPAVTPAPRSSPQATVMQPPAAQPVSGSATTVFGDSPAYDSATRVLGSPASQPAAAPMFASSPQSAPMFSPAPQAAPANIPQPPPRSSGGSRGLFVALGGLLVVGCLVAAGLYLPRHMKIRADANKPVDQTQSQQSPNSTTPAQTPPSTNPSADNVSIGPNGISASSTNPDGSTSSVSISPNGIQVSDTPTPAPSTPGDASSLQPASSGAGKKSAGSKRSHSTGDAGQQVNSIDKIQESPAAQADAAALEEAEQQNDQISSRALAAAHSIDRLRQQQAAEGYGLRGDIISSQDRLNTYMSKAKTALDRRDAAAAKKYLDQAETELAKLEKFLGH